MKAFEQYSQELQSGKVQAMERSDDSLKEPEPYVAPGLPKKSTEPEWGKIGKYMLLLLIITISLYFIFRKKVVEPVEYAAPVSKDIEYIEISHPNVAVDHRWKAAQELALARIQSDSFIVENAIAQFYASGKPGRLCILFGNTPKSACYENKRSVPLQNSQISKP